MLIIPVFTIYAPVSVIINNNNKCKFENRSSNIEMAGAKCKCVCQIITRPSTADSRNSNFEELEIEISEALFDTRFVISIFELTKPTRSG